MAAAIGIQRRGHDGAALGDADWRKIAPGVREVVRQQTVRNEVPGAAIGPELDCFRLIRVFADQSLSVAVERIDRLDLIGASAPVLASLVNGMPPWRCAADSFDGSEREGEIVPQWVADCVLRNNVPIGKDLKMAFVLVPAAKSGLPSLLQSKLNAPRVLGIDKVADYVLRKMAELGIANLAEEPLFWSPEKQAVWEEEQQKAPAMHESSSAPSNVVSKKGSSEASSSGTFGTMGIRQLQPIATTQRQMPATSPLLITCGGAAVPWDFTLAAVKQWMWKRPEDLRLEYGIRVEAGLKPPAIRPP